MRTKVFHLRLQQLHGFIRLSRARSVSADWCPPAGTGGAWSKTGFAARKWRDSCWRVGRGALSARNRIVDSTAVVGVPKALDPLQEFEIVPVLTIERESC